MSIIKDFPYLDLANFGGAWLLKDASMVPSSAALLSRNVEFLAGQVGTRHGFAPVPTTGTIDQYGYQTIEMSAWYAPFSQLNASYSDSALVVASSQGGVTYFYWFNPGTKTVTAIATLGPASGATVIGGGFRIYISIVDNKQGASRPAHVLAIPATGIAAGGPGSTFVAAGPSKYVPVITEPAAGNITVGAHRVGFLIEYISGFTTRFSPDTGVGNTPNLSTIAPIAFTAAGAKNARLSFALNWNNIGVSALNFASAVSVVMTTTSDLNQYYIVPGSRTALASVGSTAAFHIDISVSDGDLSSQGIDATPYLYWLTQPAELSSTAYPFQTRHIALLGDRMGYLGTIADPVTALKTDCLFISERNNYQAYTADQHCLQLSGQRTIVTMFRMGSINFIVGPHETYSTSDNGDVPVTWPAARLVDGRHGTLAIHGVEVAPSGDFAWLADQSGLFRFTGAPITGNPVSYYQSPDWNRINWGAAYCLRIKDDAGTKRVRVMAALDGATSPSHIFTWDYTDGATDLTVRYSLDSVDASYPLGAMELIRNDLPGQATGNQQKIELWVGSSGGPFLTPFPLLRQLSDVDTTPYADNRLAINSVWRSPPLPGRGAQSGDVQFHHGFHARIKGAGTITPKLYDVDAARSFTCRALTLAAAPDQDELFLADLTNELAFVELATNTVDTHWQLAFLRYYYSPYLMQR